MGQTELDVESSKRSGVSYRTLAITVFIALLVSAAICAAIVVPLFQNRESTSAQVELPMTSTQNVMTSPKPVESEVETMCGKVKGATENRVHVFKGIPYAVPPVGQLRWKPPVPIAPENDNCWTGLYQAMDFGNVCVQSFGSIIGSEDCLYLNVWTPTLDKSAQLPVMVYLHGGSLQQLSGNVPDGSPTATLSSDTQVVYVSLNYRLSVFGFMALDLLTNVSTTNSSGNYGFMDQQLALKWIQKNIRNFGGNPSLVTVFGESSGATSVMALLASPLSQGLFHRAWLMSSSVVMNRTLAQASDDNLRFLNNTGCEDLDCLYNLSAEQLMLAVPLYEWPRWSGDDLMKIPTKGLYNGALAIIDGYVLLEDPLSVFRAGRGISVPIMIGTLAQETDMEEPAPNIRTWTWDDYTDHVTNKLRPFGDDIANRALELYPPLQNITPEFQLTSLSTDIRVTCPNHVLANALTSSSNLRVYRYIVTSYPAKPIHIYGLPFAPAYAFHTWDSVVFFGGLKTYFSEPSTDNLAFKRIQEQEMIYFARNGFPYTPNWGPYPNLTALLSSGFHTVKAYHDEECKLWLDNGFFSYGWIN